MPHVTLIHGISNNPPAEDLLRIWRETLTNTAEAAPMGDGLITFGRPLRQSPVCHALRQMLQLA
jgi:hypothetical protein